MSINNKRTVRFCDQCKATLAKSYAFMSDEEIADVWYTDEEKKSMRYSMMKTVKSIQKNGSSSKRCIRGLEHMLSPEHLEQRQINKECNTLAVLGEQRRQRSLGINDPEEIRNMSESSSQWSKNVALKSGEMDAEDAEKVLRNVRVLMTAPRIKNVENGQYSSVLDMASVCLEQEIVRDYTNTRTIRNTHLPCESTIRL